MRLGLALCWRGFRVGLGRWWRRGLRVRCRSGSEVEGVCGWAWAYTPRCLWLQHMMMLVMPGLVAGAMLSCVSRYFTHFLALPTAMVIIPIAFYLLVYLGKSGGTQA
jgi:hypothetical protein